MEACNSELINHNNEIMEISRLEPVVIEVERNGNISSHLILFEMKCKILTDKGELVADGEIQQTVYELEEKNHEF